MRAVSDLIRAEGLSLEQTVRLWRGESIGDPRPNKALSADHLEWLLHGFDQQDIVLSTIRVGVKHPFRPRHPTQPAMQPNHKSAVSMDNALVRSIREGQDAGTYLVVSANAARHWHNLVVSPFGCVAKADADPREEARTIHDLAFPSGRSTNDLSVKEALPVLAYHHVGALARRIEYLRQRYPSLTIKMMRGDVKSAFRHLFSSADVCAYFAGCLPAINAFVIDLALPFGWTGSPAHYGAFGAAISFLVRRESPFTLQPHFAPAVRRSPAAPQPDTADGQASTQPQPGTTASGSPAPHTPSSISDKIDRTTTFFCYEWVDDHILIEPDDGDRLELCEVALRLAMLAVLGPRAINEKKFTSWATSTTALGLEWNTTNRTVSMPVNKIEKARARIQGMLRATCTTRSDFNKLLGSLRHVCSCIRPAKAFFQRLAALHRRAPRAGSIRVSDDARLDLFWFDHILHQGRLREVPLCMFSDLPAPDVHLYMDASDRGLCVLDPARRRFIRVEFDPHELHLIKMKEFTINVREQFSAALAVLCWGAEWLPRSSFSLTHIRFWIDNRAAVSWCNSLASRSAYAQELNRVIGAVEARFGLRVSAEHLPGPCNTMADLGSRAWTGQSPSIDPQDLHDHLVALQHRALADSSRRVYEATWKQWCAFCNGINVPKWLPARRPSEQSLRLALFAVHCWRGDGVTRGVSPQTVLSKLSHVRWYHRVHAGVDPHLLPQHEMALRGMRRTSPAPRTRAAVSLDMLEWLVHRLDFRVAQHRLIGGAAMLGFFFLLRSSEYLAVRGRHRVYTLQVQDIDVSDANGNPATSAANAARVRVRFRGSKADQEGRGVVLHMGRSGHPQLCPVLGAALLISHAAIVGLRPQDPICSLSKSKVLRAEDLAKLLRVAAASQGGDPSRISCHSLRSGGATALLAAGVDSTLVMLHGRWRSDAFHRYTRLTEKTGVSLASRMTSGVP